MGKLGEKAAGAAKATGKAGVELYRFLKLLVIAIIAVAIAATVYLIWDGVGKTWQTVTAPITWITGGNKPAKPVKEADHDNQVACLTAVIAKDSEDELAAHIGNVRNEIADTVLRLLVQHPALSACDVMKKGLTFFPLDWDHRAESRFWKDRNITVIKQGQSASSWTSAQLIAEVKYRRPFAPRSDRCATH